MGIHQEVVVEEEEEGIRVVLEVAAVGVIVLSQGILVEAVVAVVAMEVVVVEAAVEDIEEGMYNGFFYFMRLWD
jgi:hypothetical protein